MSGLSQGVEEGRNEGRAREDWGWCADEGNETLEVPFIDPAQQYNNSNNNSNSM